MPASLATYTLFKYFPLQIWLLSSQRWFNNTNLLTLRCNTHFVALPLLNHSPLFASGDLENFYSLVPIAWLPWHNTDPVLLIFSFRSSCLFLQRGFFFYRPRQCWCRLRIYLSFLLLTPSQLCGSSWCSPAPMTITPQMVTKSISPAYIPLPTPTCPQAAVHWSPVMATHESQWYTSLPNSILQCHIGSLKSATWKLKRNLHHGIPQRLPTRALSRVSR